MSTETGAGISTNVIGAVDLGVDGRSKAPKSEQPAAVG
jgi:hypothetical protein